MLEIKYSFILPYFERPAQLNATLWSFSALYAGLPIEVVVVDDGSDEHLRPQISSFLGFPVKVITLLEKKALTLVCLTT